MGLLLNWAFPSSGGGPPSIAAVWSQGSGGNWPSMTSLLPSVQEALAFCVAANYSRLKVEDCLQGNHTGKFIPPTSPAPHPQPYEGGASAYVDLAIS